MSGMKKSGGRRSRRVFTEEFRAGAVRLVLDEGKTVGVDRFKVAVRALIHKSETDIFVRAWACQTGRTPLVRNYFNLLITGCFCVLVLESSLSCDESSTSEAWDISGE